MSNSTRKTQRGFSGRGGLEGRVAKRDTSTRGNAGESWSGEQPESVEPRPNGEPPKEVGGISVISPDRGTPIFDPDAVAAPRKSSRRPTEVSDGAAAMSAYVPPNTPPQGYDDRRDTIAVHLSPDIDPQKVPTQPSISRKGPEDPLGDIASLPPVQYGSRYSVLWLSALALFGGVVGYLVFAGLPRALPNQTPDKSPAPAAADVPSVTLQSGDGVSHGVPPLGADLGGVVRATSEKLPLSDVPPSMVSAPTHDSEGSVSPHASEPAKKVPPADTTPPRAGSSSQAEMRPTPSGTAEVSPKEKRPFEVWLE